jgi:hypothetical protein
MTALPRALAPWAAELSVFPADVAMAIGQLAVRLSVALGPTSADASSGGGEPDGFDGVSRRGAFAHLLPSEWALADAFPDEFLRRASARELTFLQIRRRVPAAGRVAYALFDAGPAQLGGPRIVQLATLVVLSQRARASRVRFRWGIVHRPEDGWTDDVAPATVGRLIKARTATVPRTEDLRQWAIEMGRDGGRGDLWLVGSSRLAALAPGLRPAVVAIEDPLEPGERALDVTCTRFAQPQARVTLHLPDPAMSMRLLRDPFEIARASPVRSPLGENPRLVFSSGGRKVIVRRADGMLSLFTVPNSPQAQAGRVTTFAPPDGEMPIASDWQMGRWRVVTQRTDALVLHTIAKGGGPVRPPLVATVVRPLPAADGACALAPLVRRRDGVECFVHASRVGVELRGARVFPVGHAKAVGRAAGDVVWVRQEGEARWLERNGDRRALDSSGDGRTFFGWQGPSGDDWLLALSVQANQWKVYSSKTSVTLTPPAQTQVLGVVDSPALVLCEPDRRSLTLLGVHFTSPLPPLADSLSDACACPSAPYVGYTSRAGELIVYSLARQATVLHVLPDAERAS